MQNHSIFPSNGGPEFIVIISRHGSRQTALTALIRNLFPITPIFTSDNYPDANVFLSSHNESMVLAIVDGWLLESDAISGRNSLINRENTQQDYALLRCLYLIDNPKEIHVQQIDRILGSDITSNLFIETIRDMYK